jgi:predicted RNA binding protein YcfA (HicA-like mRNA interferase family)
MNAETGARGIPLEPITGPRGFVVTSGKRFCVVVCIIHCMKSAEIIKQLKADGWYLVHVVGSHHQFKHATKPGKVTVPHPKKDLPLPTVRSILKQAGL